MDITLSGVIHKVLEMQRGESKRTGKKWQMLPIVLDTVEQFPRRIYIELWGAPAGYLYHEGDHITAHVSIESQLWNERYYTKVTAWRVDRDKSATQPSAPQPNPPTPQAPTTQPAPADDLPF